VDASGVPHPANFRRWLHAAIAVVELGHAVDVVVIAGTAPARAGDIALGVDVAVASIQNPTWASRRPT
jgi:uncharacterized protein YhhL (DUF1145 family)